MALDQYLTCQIFPVQWPRFPIKTSCISQWVHLFSKSLGDILNNSCLFIGPEGSMVEGKSIFKGKTIALLVHHIHTISMDDPRSIRLSEK